MRHLLQSTLLVLSMSMTSWGSDYQVMFETMDCEGETGFSTAIVEDIYKIENAACDNPEGKAFEKLKQILIRNATGSYDTITLTAEESKNVITDMKLYMKAKRRALENSSTLIIDKERNR